MTLFFAFWINFCSVSFHPLYVSITNLDVDAQEKSIAGSLRIFTEDLETVLHNKYSVHAWLGTSSEHAEGRRLLVEYVNERFSISVNRNEKLNVSVDSMKIIEDAMWFYIKAVSSQPIHFVEIENRILTDFFERQTNLVIIGIEGKEKGFKLDRKKHKIELSL